MCCCNFPVGLLLLLLHDYSCRPEINVLLQLQLFSTVVGLLLLEAAQHSHSRIL
jgi:hypothetical protein